VAARVAAVAPSLTSEPRVVGRPGTKEFQQSANYQIQDRRLDFDQEHKRHQATIAELQLANQQVSTAVTAVKARTSCRMRSN
jgi:hypothetical protein